MMKPLKSAHGKRLRVPLWIKLAMFGAVGVAVTHVMHLVIGNYISSRALARQQANLGQYVARLVAHHGVDVVLVEDTFELEELVSDAMDREQLAYCFIERDGTVLASAFHGQLPYGRPPAELVNLRRLRRNATEPLVVVIGEQRLLDIVHPMLGDEGGSVRLGMKMNTLEATRRQVSMTLGLLAALVIVLGFVAAFAVSRRIVRPIQDILSVAGGFDPATKPSPVTSSSRDEIGELADEFNQMTTQLHLAHVEQEKTRQKQMETERLAALGSLVAGVAHEVNNPLAGLKNCQRRLLKSDLPESVRREYLGFMEEGLSRIENVVRQLLDFGRSGSIRKRETNVGEIVDAGSSLILPLLKGQRVGLQLDLGPLADRSVVVDRRRITQALLNLLLNAAYVTPAGGQIRLRALQKDSRLGISVEDDGPGIPEEIRQRIMDPFFTTKPEGKGTGLGLSVTRTIVEAHGGHLSFDFPGRGTAVTMWLPLGEAGAES